MSEFLWILIAFAASCLAAVFLFFVAPEQATRLPREFPDARFEAADRYRQTLFAALGGLAVLLTFIWTFSKDRSTLAQAADQEANRQYLEAAKMLTGPGGVSTRAAALFALGNLAATRPSLAPPIRDAIASFIGSEPGIDGISIDPDFAAPVVDGAVRAAIVVLGRRDVSNEDPRWPLDLDGTVLNGASFHHLQSFRGVSFQGAQLHDVDFRCAILDNSLFDGAAMSDYAAFTKWTDDQADAGSWEDWRKYHFIANFEGASLRGAHFRGAGLAGARFVNADVAGADFSRANLSRADFAGALNITTAIFSDKQGSACADESARFDGDVIKLRACKLGQPVRDYHFAPVGQHLSFSVQSHACWAQPRP